MSAAPTPGPAARRLRRGGLALVMVGALAVSVRGQVAAVEPLLAGMSVVLALSNDLAALLALNELMSTQRREVRRWAWAVLVLAGGTAAGLNTWHALQAGTLPPPWAVVVGIGPVLLAVVLSHLVALVLTDTAPTHVADDVQSLRGRVPSSTDESSRAAPPAPAALRGPGVQPNGDTPDGLAFVASPRLLAATHATPQASPAIRQAAAEPVDPRVERLAAQLRAGAALTGAGVAGQLGCSDRTGRRLLRQAERHAGTAKPEQERGTG